MVDVVKLIFTETLTSLNKYQSIYINELKYLELENQKIIKIEMVPDLLLSSA